MAWPVFLAELLGGLAILLGLHGRYVSAALVPVLLVATWTHVPNGWLHTSPGGGWEYPLFLAVASVVHFLIGDGAFALTGRASTLAPRRRGAALTRTRAAPAGCRERPRPAGRVFR